ncbi:MAG: bifunctional UDP-N-acetylglucosamine diphosphorylase/glucosamine-1-phosphate N-acetyltransferase GlmU [Pseudobdellovibrionaceae bacterium]
MTEKSTAKIESFSVIILAAGQGKRMKSPLPKVLHPVSGRPMIERIILAAKSAGAREVRLVVGHGQNLVRQVVLPLGVQCFVQESQQGTADAVRSAQVDSLEGDVVIMNGDHPLIDAQDIRNFVQIFREEKADLALVTAKVKNPKEMGRIVRRNGDLMAVVEAKDASAETLKINEINTGIYVVKAAVLQKILPLIKNFNAQKEFYLTDLISLSLEKKQRLIGINSSAKVAVGVNSQAELAKANTYFFRKKATALMEAGVLMLDPKAVYIEDSVEVGPGSVIYPNVFLRGKTKVGSFCVIESNSFISESQIADSVQIRAGCYLEQVEVHSKATLGPYARLRPQTVIGEEAHVGNFVEMKKVNFGKKSKAGHLTYLGDAEIGERVNIGCGTITCNYAVDHKKYKTVIGDDVFVGSDTQFVAPVNVGDSAVIGSGSTITKDVPSRALAVARSRQNNIENYVDKNNMEVKD